MFCFCSDKEFDLIQFPDDNKFIISLMLSELFLFYLRIFTNKNYIGYDLSKAKGLLQNIDFRQDVVLNHRNSILILYENLKV